MEPANFSDMRRGCWDPEARLADMDLDGVWASVHYPSLIAGFAGSNFSRCSDPGPGPGLRPGLERLAPGGVGRSSHRPVHPAAAAVAVGPRDGRGRDPAQRRAGLPGGQLPGAAGGPGPAVAAHRALGPVPGRLPGDRHGGVPALRLVGLVGVAVARRAARAADHPVPGQRPGHLRRLAVVGCAGALPRAAHLPGRIGHRLGAHAHQPHRLRHGPLGHRRAVDPGRRTGLAGPLGAPDRGACGAPSGSGSSISPRRWCCATTSASTTSCWRATTPTPTPPGPTPRRGPTAALADLPRRRGRRHLLAQRLDAVRLRGAAAGPPRGGCRAKDRRARIPIDRPRRGPGAHRGRIRVTAAAWTGGSTMHAHRFCRRPCGHRAGADLLVALGLWLIDLLEARAWLHRLPRPPPGRPCTRTCSPRPAPPRPAAASSTGWKGSRTGGTPPRRAERARPDRGQHRVRPAGRLGLHLRRQALPGPVLHPQHRLHHLEHQAALRASSSTTGRRSTPTP